MHRVRHTCAAVVLGVCLAIIPAGGHAQSTARTPISETDSIPRILKIVQKQYVDPERIDALAMLEGAFDAIQRTVPEILATVRDNRLTLTIDQATRTYALRPARTLGDLWTQLRELFMFIDLHYHGDTKADDIQYAAIDGMLKTLDPHSALLRPKEYREFQVGTKGNFGGIGIVIGQRDANLTIIAPIDGTPAARAGLKAQDNIVQIGEDSTVNMSLNEAVERLRGRVGTSVTLTVERASRPSFTVTLKRAIIRIDSVQSTTFAEGDATLGYLKVKSFQENTMDDFRTQLATLQKQAGLKFAGLILDLRNNPGGLLQQAVEMVDIFIPEGVIVSTVGANGRFLEQSTAIARDTDPPYPLVILINEGSASASEIVAGSLQANGRALVIGAQSFGKGSVQTVYNLQDGSALKLTVAEYLTAGKHSIQEIGVTPDIALRPVTVDKSLMNLLPDKRYSESDLEKHLLRHTVKPGESRYHVRYVEPPERDPEKEIGEYSTKLKLDDDFAVRFARRLLREATLAPGAAWESVQAPLKAVQGEQEKILSQTLAAQGIDWQRKPAAGHPQLRVTYFLRKENKTVSTVKAGEKAELVLTGTNIGTGTFHRLIGQSVAEHGLFANKEFVFGTLAPKEQRSWAVPIELPKHQLTEQIPVTVEFHEGNNTTPAGFQLMVPVEGRPRPQFAYSFQLAQPVKTREKVAQPLPIGKSIPLKVQVKNLGPGRSDETIVSLKNVNGNGKGAFIELGRVQLGAMEPGGTKIATLRFHVDPAFDASHFKMELTVMDGVLFENISDELDFTVESGRIMPPAGPWYQGPVITLAGAVPNATNASEQLLQGTITDDTQVKDVLVFLGDQKVFYRASAKNTGSMPLQTALPLKVGTNIVTIAARDNNDLMSRRTFTIFRKTGAAFLQKGLSQNAL